MSSNIHVYLGDELAAYGFPEGHPFGTDRQEAFWREALRQGLNEVVVEAMPVMAGRDVLEWFHTSEYVEKVMTLSRLGYGYLDDGDTPAFPGVYEAASCVAGSAVDGLKRIVEGRCRAVFQPIGGLHHARRHAAAGFCVFNDIGVAVEALRSQHNIGRVAYVDIDVHHGDGVFYSFEDDPELILVDIHEDGHYLYPGTGHVHETGRGKAKGTKLNLPMAPGAGDREFFMAWEQAEKFLRRFKPEFILFQCGADSLAGDPLAHLRYSPAAHAYAARRLKRIAGEYCDGRLIAFGGGGYNRKNLALAWCAVLKELAGPD